MGTTSVLRRLRRSLLFLRRCTRQPKVRLGMRHGNRCLATSSVKRQELNRKAPMIAHIHHGASESLWISCALIFAAVVYLRRWLLLRRHDRNFKGWRAVSFLCGLLFIWIAMASPLAELDHEMLTAHMIQHLLLMTLGPPLILLGVPRPPLMRASVLRFSQA